MKPEWEQAYDEAMDVIRRRKEFCALWQEETLRDAQEGRISKEEALSEMERINVEIDRTEAALDGLKRLLDKLKIKD